VVGTVVAAESAGAFLKQMAGKTVDGVLQGTLIDDVWNGLHSRLSSHFLENYKKLIGERFSEG
jgi:hypothetical protein